MAASYGLVSRAELEGPVKTRPQSGENISLMDRLDPVMYASLRRTPVELLFPRPIAPR